VFGARNMGGFGGCIVALAQQQHAQKLMDTLGSRVRGCRSAAMPSDGDAR
ncbi:hypothetical protein PF006_g28023, partial [Phytophthora fragariae]